MNWHSMTPSRHTEIPCLGDIADCPDINVQVEARVTKEAVWMVRWHYACDPTSKPRSLHSKRALACLAHELADLAHELAESARAPIDRYRSWADKNCRGRVRSTRWPDPKGRVFLDIVPLQSARCRSSPRSESRCVG